MARKQFFVTLYAGEWHVVANGERFGPFRSQRSAIEAAVKSAHALGAHGQDAQVLVQGQDNKFRTEWTYGHDPYPPPG